MANTRKGLRQSYQVQDLAFEVLMRLKADLSQTPADVPVASTKLPHAVALVTNAWKAAQERIQIHRGKPNPGNMAPSEREARRKPSKGSSKSKLTDALKAMYAPVTTQPIAIADVVTASPAVSPIPLLTAGMSTPLTPEPLSDSGESVNTIDVAGNTL